MLGIETVDKNNITLTFELAPEMIESEKLSIMRSGRSFPVSGFRQGKVPLKIAERVYGADVVANAALNAISNNIATMVAQEWGIAAHGVTPPTQIDEAIHVATLICDFTDRISGYRGLAYDPVSALASAEEVEAVVDQERIKNSRLIPKDSPIGKADKVTLSFSQVDKATGEQLDSKDNMEIIIGENLGMKGFYDMIEGMSPGEEKDFSLLVQNPDDLGSPPKQCDFHVKIHEAGYFELPEADDDFAQDVSEYSTMDEYRISIADKKNSSKELRGERIFITLMPKLAELIHFPVTDKMACFHIYETYSKSRNISWKQFSNFIPSLSRDEIESARLDIQVREALTCIALQENLTPPAEIMERARERHTGSKESIEAELGYIRLFIQRDMAKMLVIETAVAAEQASEPQQALSGAESPEPRAASTTGEDSANEAEKPAETQALSEPSAENA
jgi:trigger factor